MTHFARNNACIIIKLQSKQLSSTAFLIFQRKKDPGLLYTQLCQGKMNNNFLPPKFPGSAIDCFHTKTWNKDGVCSLHYNILPYKAVFDSLRLNS